MDVGNNFQEYKNLVKEDHKISKENIVTERMLSQTATISLKLGPLKSSLSIDTSEIIFNQVKDTMLKQIKSIKDAYIASTNTYTKDKWIYNVKYPLKVIELTAKIPIDQFEWIISSLKQLVLTPAIDLAIEKGQLIHDNLQITDITDNYIDATSRASSLQATEKQLLKLMDKAANVNEILQIQKELNRIIQNKESQENLAKSYKQRSTLSTLYLTLEQSTPTYVQPIHKSKWMITTPIYRAIDNLQYLFHILIDGSLYLLILLTPIVSFIYLCYKLYPKTLK